MSLADIARWLAANPYEIAGVISGVISVWLTVRENVWCWPTGIVNVVLFIVVFYQARLYADMGLQVIYVILCIYGWYEWLHGGENHGALRVTRVPVKILSVSVLGAILFLLGLGSMLHHTTNADLPYLDSSLAAFSLVAQYFQTRKWIENWMVWISVDVIYVGMYIYKGLYPTAGLYAVFLVLAVMGYVQWRHSLETNRSHRV